MVQNETAKVETRWPAWAAGYIEALEKNPNKSRAAETVGITRLTAWRWEQRDEQFKAAVQDALDRSLDLLEETILRRATLGQKTTKVVRRTLPNGEVEETITEERHISDTLAMFFLKRYRPEFRDSFRIDPDSAPLRVETVDAIDAAIARLHAELERTSGEPVTAEG